MVHKPPARQRYLDSHPRVTVILTVIQRDSLKLLADQKGLTLGQFFAELVKERGKEFVDFRRAYLGGYTAGMLGTPLEGECTRCGEVLKVPHDRVLALTEKLFSSWRHSQCPTCVVEVGRKVTRRA